MTSLGFLRIFGTVLVLTLATTVAKAGEPYTFNIEETKLIKRYECITPGVPYRPDIWVVDTKPSTKFGRFWHIVHPGSDPEYDEHYRAVMKSHNDSEIEYKKFERAWRNRTAARLPELINKCPKSKPNESLEVPKGYPMINWATIAAFFPERNPDGTLVYGINKEGERAPLLKKDIFEPMTPVKVEDGKLVIINRFQLKEETSGERGYVYTHGKRLIKLRSREYLDFEDAGT